VNNMKVQDVMLFIYDFPHKKTQDFIWRLFIEGYRIKYVLASPWINLNIPKSTLDLTNHYENLIHPKIICKKLNIRYYSLNHNSSNALNIMKHNSVDLFIISGARILSRDVVGLTENKLLNIHPGLLPESRGLDTIQWAIYNDIPLGISGHLVGKKIDAGYLIYKEKLKLYGNDRLKDISFRQLDRQSSVLIHSIKKINETKTFKFRNLDVVKSLYYSKMSKSKEKETLEKFPIWLEKYAER